MKIFHLILFILNSLFAVLNLICFFFLPTHSFSNAMVGLFNLLIACLYMLL